MTAKGMTHVKVGSDDKAALCKALVPVLQGTGEPFDLADLEYKAGDKRDAVKVTYEDGGTMDLDISLLDTGAMMILDILQALV